MCYETAIVSYRNKWIKLDSEDAYEELERISPSEKSQHTGALGLMTTLGAMGTPCRVGVPGPLLDICPPMCCCCGM